ncbi:hypothetical protein F4780DRAFT_497783 [Xylariomycetidae sp. FL0641]|nr:hypothetical protein F4780DRAFT_497783 [Xylariomycetidae sp. FL0641]
MEDFSSALEETNVLFPHTALDTTTSMRDLTSKPSSPRHHTTTSPSARQSANRISGHTSRSCSSDVDVHWVAGMYHIAFAVDEEHVGFKVLPKWFRDTGDPDQAWRRRTSRTGWIPPSSPRATSSSESMSADWHTPFACTDHVSVDAHLDRLECRPVRGAPPLSAVYLKISADLKVDEGKTPASRSLAELEDGHDGSNPGFPSRLKGHSWIKPMLS